MKAEVAIGIGTTAVTNGGGAEQGPAAVPPRRRYLNRSGDGKPPPLCVRPQGRSASERRQEPKAGPPSLPFSDVRRPCAFLRPAELFQAMNKRGNTACTKTMT